MNVLTNVYIRRACWTVLAFLLAGAAALCMAWRAQAGPDRLLTDGELMSRVLAIAVLFATAVLTVMSVSNPVPAKAAAVPTPASNSETKPYMAQVVGLQWLNPLQRMDYPTEWQLLWTLGLVRYNEDDDKVKENPQKYRTVQPIASIAVGDEGTVPFKSYHEQYLRKLTVRYRDIYFMDSHSFYNAHSRADKSTWRELAGIHVEYALPDGRFDPVEVTKFVSKTIADTFDIGNVNFPNAWTSDTPPDVRVTTGGANAGFASLKAGLDYLQAHPAETVWVMNWDAPSRPKDRQMNENMVLLVLAGPNYKTGRAPLAWLGYPASARVADFESKPGLLPRAVQAWKAALGQAALNAGKQTTDIGFAIHDAGNSQPGAPGRLASLAQTVTEEVPELDFLKQTFNTPALLGDMGAGTALTNVALGIAYANHFGKTVLVAGTANETQKIATLVVPPEVVRPIVPGKPWFRARGGNHAYLPWWGLRHDDKTETQGFSR